MYTENDVKRLFALRGELELELGVCLAQTADLSGEALALMRQRITKLENRVRMIDSLFSVLSENEAFVIRRHLLAALDWQQISKEYSTQWGHEAEKSIRSFQMYQRRGLKKIASAINTRLDISWFEEWKPR